MIELIRWKKEKYGCLLQNRSKANSDEYRRAKVKAKRVIRQHKRRADGEWERKLIKNFKGNKKLF